MPARHGCRQAGRQPVAPDRADGPVPTTGPFVSYPSLGQGREQRLEPVHAHDSFVADADVDRLGLENPNWKGRKSHRAADGLRKAEELAAWVAAHPDSASPNPKRTHSQGGATYEMALLGR